MLGFDTSNKYGTVTVSGPIEVKKSEVELFQKINTNRKLIEQFAGKIRREEDGYEKFSDQDDYVLSVLFLKEKHYEKLRKLFKKGTSLIKSADIILSFPKIVNHGLSVIDNNASEISLMIMRFIGIDLSLEEEKTYLGITEDDQCIVLPETKGKNISNLLNDFNVPPVISSDIQEIYDKGFTMEIIGSIAISSLAFFYTKKYSTDSFENKKHGNLDLDGD